MTPSADAIALCERTRAAQGLPATVEDAIALRRVATVLGAPDDRAGGMKSQTEGGDPALNTAPLTHDTDDPEPLSKNL